MDPNYENARELAAFTRLQAPEGPTGRGLSGAALGMQPVSPGLAMNVLHQASQMLDQLHVAIMELEDRLAPILRPIPPNNAATASTNSAPAVSPMLELGAKLIGQSERATQRVHALMHRLDV